MKRNNHSNVIISLRDRVSNDDSVARHQLGRKLSEVAMHGNTTRRDSSRSNIFFQKFVVVIWCRSGCSVGWCSAVSLPLPLRFAAVENDGDGQAHKRTTYTTESYVLSPLKTSFPFPDMIAVYAGRRRCQKVPTKGVEVSGCA